MEWTPNPPPPAVQKRTPPPPPQAPMIVPARHIPKVVPPPRRKQVPAKEPAVPAAPGAVPAAAANEPAPFRAVPVPPREPPPPAPAEAAPVQPKEPPAAEVQVQPGLVPPRIEKEPPPHSRVTVPAKRVVGVLVTPPKFAKKATAEAVNAPGAWVEAPAFTVEDLRTERPPDEFMAVAAALGREYALGGAQHLQAPTVAAPEAAADAGRGRQTAYSMSGRMALPYGREDPFAPMSLPQEDATGGVGPNAARPPLHRKRLVLDEVEAEVEVETNTASREQARFPWDDVRRRQETRQAPQEEPGTSSQATAQPTNKAPPTVPCRFDTYTSVHDCMRPFAGVMRTL
ncbi:unnamed protein product [Symbiodinium microadriaticum]|nr:unnamed protein product [Symbiodinium microadriaticum]CAE7684210.1 unnamed protein product [Symbiodinium sp. KB8]